jgi:hypothetical protein
VSTEKQANLQAFLPCGRYPGILAFQRTYR